MQMRMEISSPAFASPTRTRRIRYNERRDQGHAGEEVRFTRYGLFSVVVVVIVVVVVNFSPLFFLLMLVKLDMAN